MIKTKYATLQRNSRVLIVDREGVRKDKTAAILGLVGTLKGVTKVFGLAVIELDGLGERVINPDNLEPALPS
jgi:hypothetical protein